MRRLVLLVGLLMVPFMWLGAEPAAACRCVQSTMPDFVARADVIASGRLVEREDLGDQSVEYTFAGSERFEGTLTPGFVVRSSVSSASCGLTGLVVGRRYVVFMAQQGGVLTANSCGGTRPATPEYVERVEAVTGPGTSFGGVPVLEGMGPAARVAHALAAALSGSVLWD